MFNFNNLEKTYRPELNGLRALAVLLVLFYHLNISWLGGGYLGVDIFLVISGYFISKNIISDIQQKRFSFKHFYTKRLRRLFPALLATLILTVISGYFILIPSSFQRLGLSSIFASISASNFFFWSEAGYFDGEAISKPLLHMWSLSLEEQFYLFWPLLLFLLFKKSFKRLGVWILLGIVVSVVLAESFYSKDPSAVFFMLPFRMFEFWLGAISIGLERNKIFQKNRTKEGLFVTGLLLMIGASIFLDSESKMPGLLSLIPCVGAMMIIFGGQASLMSWTLKNKLMESIGKASYSIYLIHWPLLVFYHYKTLVNLTTEKQIILGSISILLGFLMWHFVENTFRYSKLKLKQVDPVWFGVPFIILLFSFTSYMIFKSDILVTKNLGELYMTQEEIMTNRKSYWQDSNSQAKVLKGNPDKGRILVFGNSHAIDLIYALRLNGFEGNIISLQTGGRCYNFGYAEKPKDKSLCKEKLLKNLANPNWNKVNAIVMHDDWPIWDREGLQDIIKQVRAKTQAPIYVLGPKLTFTHLIPDIVHSIGSTNPNTLNKDAMKFSELELKKNINDSLSKEFRNNQFYKENDIHYIDFLKIQGGEELNNFEVISEQLQFLYFDRTHFTKSGSKIFGEKLKQKYPSLFSWD